MSIWIHRDSISHEVAERMATECIITEEIDDYAKGLGTQPRELLMFKKDKSGQYFIVPAFIARKYGYQPINPFWKQTFFSELDNLEKINPNFTGTFRDYQIELIPQIIKYIQETCSCVVGLPPGYGKTIIAAYLIHLCKYLAIVICKQSKVFEGWKTTFAKVLPDARIWIVGENDHLFRRNINGKIVYEGFHIILCMNERIEHIPDFVKYEVGTLVIDEVHTIATYSQVDTFLGFSPKYIIFESATFESSTFWRMAAACSGEHGVFRVSNIPHYVFAVRTGIRGKVETKNGRVIPSSIQKSLLQDKLRMNIILNLIYNHIGFRKFIILQKLTEGIDEMKVMVNNLGISSDTLYGSKSDYSQSQVLIGTVQKMGTGFDEENACKNFKTNPIKSNTLIIANSILSKYLYYQCVGRVMRCASNDDTSLIEIPAIIYLIDENSNTQKNFKALEPFIRESNGVIYYVDYRNVFIPVKTIRYQHFYTQSIFYKILKPEEYEDFYKYGIYIGNKEEQENKYVLLQTSESVAHYKNLICPNTPCFILTLQYCNLYTYPNGIPYFVNGILFCKHSIFMRNVIAVNRI